VADAMPPWAALPSHHHRLGIDDVTAALAARGPGRPSPVVIREPKHAAVLAALFDDGGEAHVLLTRRSSALNNHAGQVSFPGGRMDPGETTIDTALREAHEEVALDPSGVRIIGELDDVATIVSRSLIHPLVGVLDRRPADLTPSPAEVDRVFTVPLSELVAPGVFREERWGWGGVVRPVWFFELDGDTVWGATAAMLRQLLLITLDLEQQ
jgi:8-oxo-dGTP pyrophosphatase MutT (NUDIX family)